MTVLLVRAPGFKAPTLERRTSYIEVHYSPLWVPGLVLLSLMPKFANEEEARSVYAAIGIRSTLGSW